MPLLKLTRDQERRLKKLDERVGRVTQADRRFFERRPDRQHRVRLASQAEIEQEAIALVGPINLPPNYQQFMAIKNVSKGVRMRIPVIRPLHGDTDLDEDTARTVYELVNNDEARRIEADMRDIASVRP